LANIGILDPDGRVRASAFPLASEHSWQQHPVFLAALQATDVVAGTYQISPIFARPTLNHALAVRNANHQITAVLFNGLDLAWLSQMARQSPLPDGFTLLITDREGTLLARCDPEESDAHLDREQTPIPGIEALASTHHGQMVATPQGYRYLVAVPLHGADGLLVAVALPYQRVMNQANQAFTRTLVGLGLLTAFTILAVFLAAEIGILRSLRSLARVAQRLGTGDLAARARIPRGHGELAALASSFNSMAEALEAWHNQALMGQARLRQLATRLQEVREAESARIARELHDEMGQLLTSVRIGLSRLTATCPNAAATDCAQQLATRVAELDTLINEAIGAVRRIATELRPVVLDKLGLTAAIAWQAREIEARSDLAVTVEADPIDGLLDEKSAITIFRIVQEALTNALRHARAQLVTIELTRQAESIVLIVSDDGIGIPPESTRPGTSLGIIGIQERAMLIGATVAVSGHPGVGTRLEVRIPLTAPATSPAFLGDHP
jgi:signal transduction histidine kinase